MLYLISGINIYLCASWELTLLRADGDEGEEEMEEEEGQQGEEEKGR